MPRTICGMLKVVVEEGEETGKGRGGGGGGESLASFYH